MGRHQALRVTLLAGVCFALLAGCTPGQHPKPVQDTPTTAPSSVADTRVVPVPPVDPAERSRVVWDGALNPAQPVRMDVVEGAAWVVQGACDGGGDLALTYRVLVDGVQSDAGTITCSTGRIFANTALGQVAGSHTVHLEVGEEVEHTRSAWVRLLPAGSL